jgi:ABC-type phosphate/phosphonate transport system substrate-binding protein
MAAGGFSAEPEEKPRPPLRLAFPEAALQSDPGFHERLAQALEKRLAEADLPFERVELSPAASWLELAGSMRAERCDLALGPPTILVGGGKAWRAVLQERRAEDAWDDRPGGSGVSRESVLIAREDSPWTSLETLDAAARNSDGPPLVAAFVAPESATGFAAPRLFLAARGFAEGRVEERFLDTEENVFLAVANGMADVGALERTAFEALSRRHEQAIRDHPLARGSSPKIAASVSGPSPPLAASGRLERELGVRDFRRLVAIFRESAAEASAGKIEFVPVSSAVYREIVENARRWYSDMPFFELLEASPQP